MLLTLEGLGRSATKLMHKLLAEENKGDEQEIYRHAPKRVITRRSTDCYAVRNPLVSNALLVQNNFIKVAQKYRC